MLYKDPQSSEPQPPPDALPPAVPQPESPLKPINDDVIQRLRQGAKRKRPRSPLSWILTIVFIAIPAAFLAWLLWPRVYPPELVVVGFDAVTCVGKPATLRAATHPLYQTEAKEHWSGLVLYFEDVAATREKRVKPAQARTSPLGVAELSWPTADEPGTATFNVLYVDPTPYRRWYDQSQLRVFTWPKEARILVIDFEPTLKKAEPHVDMAKALQDAALAEWHIVYLALDAKTPLDYQKARNWAMGQIGMNNEAIPNGPVLGSDYASTDKIEIEQLKQHLTQFKKTFGGSLVFLDSEQALRLREVNTTRELFGESSQFEDWKNLAEALKKWQE